MKMHFRDDCFNTEENRLEYKNSPHVLWFMTTGHFSDCGIGCYDGYITSDISLVTCKKCLSINMPCQNND